MTLELETTHDIHEEVYFLINQSIKHSRIEQVLVSQSHILENPFEKSSNVRYDVTEKYKVLGYNLPFRPTELFKTQNELINSIL